MREPLAVKLPISPSGLGEQYFHGSVGRLLQQSSVAYLRTMRQAAANAGK